MKSFIGRIVLLVASCLLLFVLLEITLRLRGYGTLGVREGNVVHHRVGEFEHDAILNSLDLRDTEIEPKPPGEYRILILGDSFVYGLGVNENETFVRRTERLLRERAQREGRSVSVRVVNGGVGGGPFQEGKWLRDVGSALEPDLVVLGFFIGNDLYDDMAWRQKDGASEGDEPARHGLRDLLRGSKALDWTWSRILRVPAIDRSLFRLGLRRTEAGLYLIDQPELERHCWRGTLAKIEEIDALVHEHDAHTLVLIIPTSEQVRYGQEARGPGQDSELPNRVLSEFLVGHGIEYLDLLPAMRDEPGHDRFYYVRDLHWTAEGHSFAAQALAERLWSSYSLH